MSKEIINNFRDKYFFLSNFYPSKIYINGFTFNSAEAAFQAMKCPSRMQEFINLPPNEAKRLGRKVKLRSDWELVKDGIMYRIVMDKFLQNKELKEQLLNTKDAILIEGNTWNDIYWGVCNARGKNMLGKILMEVREEIKNLDDK